MVDDTQSSNVVYGRIYDIRDHGKIVFIDLKQNETINKIESLKLKGNSVIQYALEGSLTRSFSDLKEKIYKGCNVKLKWEDWVSKNNKTFRETSGYLRYFCFGPVVVDTWEICWQAFRRYTRCCLGVFDW